MLRHNLLFIYRTFLRFKNTFFINLIGLATGLSCTLLIYLWVNDELSVDKFHKNDSRLFQVIERLEEANGIIISPLTAGPLTQALAEEMAEVESAAAATQTYEDITLSVNEKNIKADGKYVGKDFFKLFSYGLIEGDESQVLLDKYSIVISDELAMRLFNTTENLTGKTVEFQKDQQYQISGIFSKVPHNSSEQFDFVLSFELFLEKDEWNLRWDNSAAFAYVLLKPDVNIEEFDKKIADYIRVKTNKEIMHRTPMIKKYSENYLYGHYENGVQSGGRIEYVTLFSIIAIFILAIACINFMNLSTAKASRRLKEVGIKKAIGADSRDLIFQFLGESMLMAFTSLIIAIILIIVCLPLFNEITGKHLFLTFNLPFALSVLGITLFTGFVSGSYPALYLSSFSFTSVLKGKLDTNKLEIWTRKGLVVFQFAISVILIVSVVVVYNQIKFVQTKNLGYNKENIIFFQKEGKAAEHFETFLSKVENIPGVKNASSIKHDMTGHSSSTYRLKWEGKNPEDKTSFENISVNYDMVETLGIEMKEGRTFSRDFGSDSSKIIFNEAAIAHMGLQDPIGKTVRFWGKDMQIIGVAKDFHFESLREEVKPLLFRLDPKSTLMFMVKIEEGREKEVIEGLQEFYSTFNPGFPFEYRFLDQEYQMQYVAEQRVAAISRYFAALAILISCLGLLGLAAFTAERRTKEIGIRKILGSSNFTIFRLLTGEFTKMVLVAIFIALPLSYFIASKWLDTFAFKIDLEWWYFLGAGSIALLVAWFTVGTQVIKAARINPVKCLKNE
jgi:predicted permease